jgi:hypothetical protein
VIAGLVVVNRRAPLFEFSLRCNNLCRKPKGEGTTIGFRHGPP